MLAVACAAAGARLVQLSTDYVFPGRVNGAGGTPYEVDDEPGPLSAYGRTKLAGEQAVHDTLIRAASVVRTAWVYGAAGTNFVKTMATLERTSDTVGVVADQTGSPTWAADLAEALLALCRSDAPRGTYHATNQGAASWHRLAQAVFVELGADPARVLPTDSSILLRPAHRPAYSVLSPTSWSAAGLPPLPTWLSALTAAFRVDGGYLRGRSEQPPG